MKRYEISLWDNCHNGCSFCWTFRSSRSNKVCYLEQLKALTKANELLDLVSPEDDVLITGGEVFDIEGEELSIGVEKLLDRLITDLLFNKLHHLFIITNLVHSNTKVFDHFLNLLHSLPTFCLERVHITTSYDVVGRFHSEEDKDEFFQHLLQLSNLIPQANLTVNTILTKSACEAVLSGALNVLQNQDLYKCSWELIPFVGNIPEEMPTKDMVFTVLKHMESKCPGYLNKFLPDLKNQTNSIYLKLRGNEVIDSTVDNLPCGHSVNFTKYASDSESCFLCDLDEYFNLSGKHNGYISIELWPDCSINCPFCFNNDRKIPTPDARKIECINKVLKYLKQDFYKYTTIQIMGGEFFNGELDNPEVLSTFLDLCSYLNELATKHNKNICIYSALKQEKHLKEALDILYNKTDKDKIKFNSSFNYGITHKGENVQLFIDKILKIRQEYPLMKIHVQSLLSDQIINTPFDEVLDIYRPLLENNIEVDFHPVTIIGVNTWTNRTGEHFKEILRTNPITKNIAIKSRDKALEFCTNLYYNFGHDCFHNFRVNTTRAETKWLVVPDKWEENIATSNLHCDMEKCGHTYHLAHAYLDSDECLSCDINKLLEVLE